MGFFSFLSNKNVWLLDGDDIYFYGGALFEEES